MADPVVLSRWGDESVRVADVLDALVGLRRPEPLPPTRTSVLTLVVLADPALSEEQSGLDEAMAALYELGGRHPARVLVLLPDRRRGGRGVDAQVRLLGGSAEGHDLWFEDVELVVRGEAVHHLQSVIEPFTLPDLPVVVWFVDALPRDDDPLLSSADVALVDTRRFGDGDCFEALLALTDRLPVVDLSWQRVQPWRELLADLFEPPVARPFLAGVRTVRVAGHLGPRQLLAGWLAERLQVRSEHVRLEEAEHLTIEVVATSPVSGHEGRFTVERRPGERVVRARSEIGGAPTTEAVVPLPPRTPGWGLASALARLAHDPVYERALAAALALTPR